MLLLASEAPLMITSNGGLAYPLVEYINHKENADKPKVAIWLNPEHF